MLTAGMTAEKQGNQRRPAIVPILCDQDEFGKAIGEFIRGPRLVVAFVLDLVEEGIAQAVGVGIPLAGPLLAASVASQSASVQSLRCIARSKPLPRTGSDHSTGAELS